MPIPPKPVPMTRTVGSCATREAFMTVRLFGLRREGNLPQSTERRRNNAGIAPTGSIESTTLDAYLRVTMVNQVGVFLGMKTTLRGLRVSDASAYCTGTEFVVDGGRMS